MGESDQPALVGGVVVVPGSLCSELLAVLRESGRRPVGVAARAWTARMQCLVRTVEAGVVQHATERVRLQAGSVHASEVVPGGPAPAPLAAVLLGEVVGAAEAATIVGVSARHIRALAAAGRIAGARREPAQLRGDRAQQTRWVLPLQAVEAYRNSRSDLEPAHDDRDGVD